MKIVKHIHTMNYFVSINDFTKDWINPKNKRIGFNFKEGHNTNNILWGGYVL